MVILDHEWMSYLVFKAVSVVVILVLLLVLLVDIATAVPNYLMKHDNDTLMCKGKQIK